MANTHSSPSSEKMDALVKKFEKNPNTKDEIQKLQDALYTLSDLSRHFHNSSSPEVAARIIQTLNRIRNVIHPMSTTHRRDVISELQKNDTERWKNHKWEEVRWKSMDYHENNDNTKDQRRGISSDNIMTNPLKLAPDDYVRKQVMMLAAIYGLSILDIVKASRALRPE